MRDRVEDCEENTKQEDEAQNQHTKTHVPQERIEKLKKELREAQSQPGETIVEARTKSRLRNKLQVAFHRGSRYRGVSMNGTKWQALLMVNKHKRYLGSYTTEEEAAVAYDMHSFLLHGLKVKTKTEQENT